MICCLILLKQTTFLLATGACAMLGDITLGGHFDFPAKYLQISGRYPSLLMEYETAVATRTAPGCRLTV